MRISIAEGYDAAAARFAISSTPSMRDSTPTSRRAKVRSASGTRPGPSAARRRQVLEGPARVGRSGPTTASSVRALPSWKYGASLEQPRSGHVVR